MSNNQADLLKRLELLEAKMALRDLIDRFPHYLDRTVRTKAVEDCQAFADLSTDDIVSSVPYAVIVIMTEGCPALGLSPPYW